MSKNDAAARLSRLYVQERELLALAADNAAAPKPEFLSADWLRWYYGGDVLAQVQRQIERYERMQIGPRA